MTKKVSVLLGSLIFLSWMALPIGWLFTGDGSWIVIWLFLAIFLFPFWWQVIVVVVGKEKSEEHANSIFRTVLMLAASALMIGAISVFIYQLFNYLKNGSWISISIMDCLLSFELNWATNPKDWLGVWKILNYLPLSLSLFIAGALILALRERS